MLFRGTATMRSERSIRRMLTAVLALSSVILVLGCGKKEETPVVRVIDREKNEMVVITGDRTGLHGFYDADIVIVGGGLGGIAATIAACQWSRNTILIDETDGIAACFSSPQDTSQYYDSALLEKTGTSRRYQAFRDSIRAWYAEQSLEQPVAAERPFLSLKEFGETDFCFSSEAAIAAIYTLIDRYIERKQITFLNRRVVASAVKYNTRLSSINVVNLDDGVVDQVTGWMYLDATEHGDLLPVLGIPYRVGPESRTETGEPHAPESPDSLVAYDLRYYQEPSSIEPGQRYNLPLLETPPQGAYVTIALPRESRRMRTALPVTEQDIAAVSNSGPRARFFADAIGIGYAPMHVDEGGTTVVIPTKPFQIPMHAILPQGIDNLLIAGGALGCTYVAASAYGDPSVVWAIGEGAGEVGAFATGRKISTWNLLDDPALATDFRTRSIRDRGIPLYWYDNLRVGDPDFTTAQMKPFETPGYHESQTTLTYHP